MSSSSQQNRVQITKHIMHILDEWGLSGKDTISILALPSKTRTRHLEHFRDGSAFPENEKTMQCIGHIAGIADALRTSYPRNAHMGIVWMRTPHRRFNNQSPLEVLPNRGLSGLKVVRAELDCAFAWDESSAN